MIPSKAKIDHWGLRKLEAAESEGTPDCLRAERMVPDRIPLHPSGPGSVGRASASTAALPARRV